jgi:hypothetical protein
MYMWLRKEEYIGSFPHRYMHGVATKPASDKAADNSNNA